MTKFTIEGVFKDHTIKEKDSKKDEGGKYLAGEVMFEIDNTDGKYGAVEVIPFSVFGKSAEAGQTLLRGQRVQITFRLSGREWQGRYYPSLKAIFFKPVEQQEAPRPKHDPLKDSEVPF
jgi:hypothetical protein